MFGRLANLRLTSVSSAALLLGAASLLSRGAGVVRDRLLSGTFGAGRELDAYYAAFRAPDFVFNLLVIGAITAGFIPVFTRFKNGDRDVLGAEERAFVANIITILGIVIAACSVIGALAAPWFVPKLAPGFDGREQALTAALTRIMFISPLFLGLSSVFGSILQSYRRFFIYAMAPVFYNLGIIVGTVLLAPPLGITGVAIGVIAGALLHFSVQFLACRSLGFSYRPRFDPRHEGVRAVGRLMLPRTAALAASQINLTILTGIASTLGIGGIAIFTFANNLQSFPVGILGFSFAIAAFPMISELAAAEKREAVIASLSKTVRAVMFLVIPVTIAFLLLRAQIVRVALGTGNFDWADTIGTADTLSYFTLSLFAQALLPLVVRTFFAFEDVKTPLMAGAAAIVCERLAAWYLVRRGMGIPGLALAFSLGSIVNVSLLWVALRMRLGSLDEKRIFRSLALMSFAGLFMGAAVQGAKIVLGGLVDMRTFVGIFTQGVVSGMLGIGVYVGASIAMGGEEARGVAAMLKRRTSGAPVAVHQEGETLKPD